MLLSAFKNHWLNDEFTILEELEDEFGDSEILIEIDAKYLGLLKDVQCDEV